MVGKDWYWFGEGSFWVNSSQIWVEVTQDRVGAVEGESRFGNHGVEDGTRFGKDAFEGEESNGKTQ